MRELHRRRRRCHCAGAGRRRGGRLAGGRRPGAAQHQRPRPRPRHGRARDGRRPARRGCRPTLPPAGHIVKARYTPLQVAVGSRRRAGLRRTTTCWPRPTTSAALPVVVADLHSALPAICVAIAADRPGTRVAYVMTDGGALPLQLLPYGAGAASRPGCWSGRSRPDRPTAATSRRSACTARCWWRGWCCEADVVVVTQGPGNLGTDTRWGFSGVACGDAVNAVGVLGGRPVGSLRISGADARERHLGVSHHSLTAYGRVALMPADLAVPALGETSGSTGAATQLERLARTTPAGRGRRDGPRRRSEIGCCSKASRCRRWAAACDQDLRLLPGRGSSRPARRSARATYRPEGCCVPARSGCRGSVIAMMTPATSSTTATMNSQLAMPAKPSTAKMTARIEKPSQGP